MVEDLGRRARTGKGRSEPVSPIRLSAAAEGDIMNLLAYTDARFGPVARRRYEALLTDRLEGHRGRSPNASAVAPDLSSAMPSAATISDTAATGRGPLTGSSGDPVICCPIAPSPLTRIGVGRVLHDAMELERHSPDRFWED